MILIAKPKVTTSTLDCGNAIIMLNLAEEAEEDNATTEQALIRGACTQTFDDCLPAAVDDTENLEYNNQDFRTTIQKIISS
jgi:hypothetical protein